MTKKRHPCFCAGYRLLCFCRAPWSLFLRRFCASLPRRSGMSWQNPAQCGLFLAVVRAAPGLMLPARTMSLFVRFRDGTAAREPRQKLVVRGPRPSENVNATRTTICLAREDLIRGIWRQLVQVGLRPSCNLAVCCAACSRRFQASSTERDRPCGFSPSWHSFDFVLLQSARKSRTCIVAPEVTVLIWPLWKSPASVHGSAVEQRGAY